MSGEVSGEQPEDFKEEDYQPTEHERLMDLVFDLERQISTGERSGIEAINDYVRAQRDLERELARVKPTEYFMHTQRAEYSESILKSPSYEGKARICEEEAEYHEYLSKKGEFEKYDPTKPEDPNRDQKIKQERKAAASWLRLKADCLDDETSPEEMPLKEQI